MRIKKLHLQGFKSFADPTDIHLSAGITSIVGPNGCGKSNVIDGLKWAMGEMSAKLLRGQSMEDVIFGGSESRKPVGMAEVSVTFENEGPNRPPGYEQYSEIEITRRLYRNGDSEYLINKAPARLRDIQELFMDTGVGARAYSIIEQGQIGALVNARPEDRRYLIEEAAGITKFKKRKDEALRKMESTEQNLLRVGDLSRELRRQLNSLDRQARKAERFKELQFDMQKIELGLLFERYGETSEQLRALRADIERMTAEEAGMSSALGQGELDTETLKLEIAQLEKQLVTLRDAAFEAARKVSDHEKDLEINRSRLEAVTLQIDSLARELEDADRRRSDLESEIIATEGALETLENDFTQREEAVRSSEGELAGRQARLAELASSYDEAGRLVMDLMQKMSEKKADVERARARRDELIRRMEDTQVEVDDQKHALEHTASRVVELTQVRDEAVAEKDELTKRRDKLTREIEEIRASLQESLPRLEESRRILGDRESRLRSLRELASAHEGLREGVRELLEKAKTDTTSGFEGIVADMIEPTAGLEEALAAALGDRLEAILVRDPKKALEAVRHLREGEGRGRAVFLPTAAPAIPREGGPAGKRLSERLRFQGTYGQAARRLLEQVLLADSDEEALQLAAEHPGFTVVSVAGMVVQADGCISGGGEERGTQLLKQRREALELEDEIRERKSALRSLEEDVDVQKRREQWLLDESEQARTELQRAEVQLAELQKDLANATAERDRLTRELESLQDEVSHFQDDMDAALERLGDSERELVDLNRQREESVAKREELAEQHAQARSALDALNASIADLRVELADARSALASRRELAERLKRDRMAMDERGRRADLELEENRRRKTELEDLLARDGGGTDALLADKMALEEKVIQAAEGYESEKRKLFELEVATRDSRREHEALRQTLAREQLKLVELQKDVTHIESQFEERFQLQTEQLESAEMDREGSPEERAQRLAGLKRQAEAMGEINLAAIHEYKEIEQRYNFIEDQQNDLLESLDALKKAINKINKTSRERFQATFDTINEKFQMVFPRLFNGGQAELRLTEGEDLLESGVEIIAQPPGKKLQRVNLMSGGEKALTAVALIFAIFLLKPSPFCILDEVDAPLDDANIDRFNALLEEMNRMSQIIMVTHNKHTMEIADEMYGVTMEEMGVSRVVSVQLT